MCCKLSGVDKGHIVWEQWLLLRNNNVFVMDSQAASVCLYDSKLRKSIKFRGTHSSCINNSNMSYFHSASGF